MEKSKVKQEGIQRPGSGKEPGWRKQVEREPGVGTESWAWRQSLKRRSEQHCMVSSEDSLTAGLGS